MCFFQANLFASVTHVKQNLETLNKEAWGLYRKLFMVFGIGKFITCPFLACCMLLPCVCYCNLLPLLFPQANTHKRAAFLEVLLFFGRFFQLSKLTTNHEGREKKESPQAVPGTTKIESLLHALLLQFDLLIKKNKKYNALQAKWVMWNQSKAALKEMRRLKVQ